MMPLPAGLALGGVLAWALYRPVIGMLAAAGAVRPNYAGRQVPVAGGLVFVLAAVAAQTLQAFLSSLLSEFGLAGLLSTTAFTLTGFAFLGLLDDLFGSRETGGFRGHFRVLFQQGRLTSGTLKALGGGVVAAWPALAAAGNAAAGGPGRWIMEGTANLLVVALTANAVNLLDLRPGRAFKGFLLFWAAGILVAWGGHPVWAVGAPLVGAACVVGWHDLRAEVMMGDTGANCLGAYAGLGIAWSWGFTAKLWWVAALVLFHLYTERVSLTATIERVPFLQWLDRLGRPADGKDG